MYNNRMKTDGLKQIGAGNGRGLSSTLSSTYIAGNILRNYEKNSNVNLKGCHFNCHGKRGSEKNRGETRIIKKKAKEELIQRMKKGQYKVEKKSTGIETSCMTLK